MAAEGTYTKKEIEDLGARYEAISSLFRAMASDIRTLSSKKPEGLLNPRKIATVNRILTELLEILEKEPTKPYLENVEEDHVPQYSDVAMIVGQYEAALGTFKKQYRTVGFGGSVTWDLDYYEDDEDEDDEEQV